MTFNKRILSSSISAPKKPPKGTSTTKRKHSDDLDYTPALSQKKSKTTQPQKGRPIKNAPTPLEQKHPPEDYEEKSYSIECPAAKAPKKNEAQDVFRGRDGDSLGLGVDYAVRPGDWDELKSYGQIKYNGLNLRKGDFAYFAKTLAAPEETSEEETIASYDPLKYERDNFYIGQIAEARADNPSNVYVRVLYAYWPEELVQGRQPYHGMKEVVISNHIDIMDAHTIMGKVEVQRIDELDESAENVDGIYWRQTLDISKYAPGKRNQLGVLSKLRGTCGCGQPMNPDKSVYACRNCTTWNHEECLIEEVLENASEKYVAGTLCQDEEDNLNEEEDDSIEVAPEQKKRSHLMGDFAKFASKLVRGSPALASQVVDHNVELKKDKDVIKDSQLGGPGSTMTKKALSVKKTLQSNGKARDQGARRDNQFRAIIDATGKFGKAGTVTAQILDEVSGKVMWITALSCLKCEKRLD